MATSVSLGTQQSGRHVAERSSSRHLLPQLPFGQTYVGGCPLGLICENKPLTQKCQTHPKHFPCKMEFWRASSVPNAAVCVSTVGSGALGVWGWNGKERGVWVPAWVSPGHWTNRRWEAPFPWSGAWRSEAEVRAERVPPEPCRWLTSPGVLPWPYFRGAVSDLLRRTPVTWE